MKRWNELDQRTLDEMAVPKLTDVEQVAGGWIKKYSLHLLDQDGRAFRYDAVSRKGLDDFSAGLKRAGGIPPMPDAVAIIAFTEADEVLLMKEYRYPLGRWCTSFPAGLIDSGEDPIDAVERELREETGFRVVRRSGAPACRFTTQAAYSSNGMTDESILSAFALVEPAGAAQPDAHELIEPFLLPFKEVQRFLESDRSAIGVRCQFILEGLACGARFV